jgi:hypothetical protein
MVQFWAHWLNVGLASLLGLVGLFITYSKKSSPSRQYRWLEILAYVLFAFFGNGFLAFGESFLLRDDGFHILFGRWWLYAILILFASAVVVEGIADLVWLRLGVVTAAAAHAVGLLGVAYSTTKGCTTQLGPLIFGLVFAAGCALIVFALEVIAIFRWPGTWFGQEQHKPEGTAHLPHWGWYLLAALGNLVVMAVAILFAALGVEGCNKYGGSLHHNENVQIWLMDFGVTAGTVLLMVAVYWFLDPSGSKEITEFNEISTSDATPTLQQPATATQAGEDLEF